MTELLHGLNGPDFLILSAILLGAPTLTALILARIWRIQRARDKARYRRMVRRSRINPSYRDDRHS